MTARAVTRALALELVFAAAILGPAWGVVVTGSVAVLLTRLGPVAARRVVVVLSAGLLVAAAVLTTLEAPLRDQWTLRFAADRPIASWAAAMAAAFAMAAVACTWATASTGPPVPARTERRGAGVAARSLHGPALVLVALAVAAGVRSLLGPGGLDPVVEQAAANVASGVHFATGAGVDRAAPLVPVLLLVTGVGAVGMGVAGAALVAGTAAALRRARGPLALFTAAALAALLPSTWSQPLPVLLAAALVGAAVALLIGPDHPSPQHGATAAALLGAALLADPTTVIAGAVVGVWVGWRLWDRTLPSSVGWAFGAAYLAMATLTLAATSATGTSPGTWWRSGGPQGDPGSGWLVLEVVVGLAALVALWRGRVPLVLAAVGLGGIVTSAATGPTTALWGWAAAVVAAAAAAAFDPTGAPSPAPVSSAASPPRHRARRA